MNINNSLYTLRDYLFANEMNHFIEHFELDVETIDDGFLFEPHHKDHVFYHAYMLDLALRTNPYIEKSIALLMRYSFMDIHFAYDQLTEDEKKIVGSQARFNELVDWVSERAS